MTVSNELQVGRAP